MHFLETISDIVVCIEVIESYLQLFQNGFAVRYQNVEQFFVFFDIVRCYTRYLIGVLSYLLLG